MTSLADALPLLLLLLGVSTIIVTNEPGKGGPFDSKAGWAVGLGLVAAGLLLAMAR